jgi:predicted nucleotidyltransferase
MGLDTVNRLMDDYKTNDFYDLVKMKENFKNINIFCFNRNGSNINEFIKDESIFYFETTEFEEISSTKIRELLKNNDNEEIKKIVPTEIYDKVIKNNWDN